ncbi:phosphatidylserine decarboxylase [Brevibacillus fluminis]|uniref:Phosphatidylserine decarboxylase proenzyme n=1 Tax=Brevibacillus fluminis TaxID=511487 RepID=A0A3M8D009_9BACL|nr:archaetidylserine decarboxylase [Brevibacillus fluminis]RNB81049.1 phosphatidylserine decarboxylase [Brevibacillus fluminis]
MRKGLIGKIIHRLPQNAMSRTMGKITASRFSRVAIRRYVHHYKIDLDVVEKPVGEYRTLKEFFARRLKPSARPIATAPGAIVSPVDGKVSQLGDIMHGTLIQAKGKEYSVAELLGDHEELASRFYGGKFITIYLSPRDYHRIHMPVDGTLEQYTYLPGRLYPVNDIGVQQVDCLFARNERLITFVKSEEAGCVAVVKVGALFVGSVKVTYNRATTNVKHGRVHNEQIAGHPSLDKGQELGWFEFGSTVILLFEKGRMDWVPGLREGSVLQMGQQLGQIDE